jgi:hypothetical protein
LGPNSSLYTPPLSMNLQQQQQQQQQELYMNAATIATRERSSAVRVYLRQR